MRSAGIILCVSLAVDIIIIIIILPWIRQSGLFQFKIIF
jgi:hypothetical protein